MDLATQKILLDLKRTKNVTGKKYLILTLSILLMTSFAISGCQIFYFGKLKVIDIKMAPAISENLMPLKPTDSFPNGTSKVFCWFRWENAETNSQVIAKWHYTSEDIDILNYPLNIPRRDGSGSVVLSMPEGKTLPSGSYRIDLVINKHIVKSREFKIE